MLDANSATVLLAGTIFLALIIERILEVLKGAYDVLEARTGGVARWNAHAEKVQRRLHFLVTKDRAEAGRSGPALGVLLRTVLRRLRPAGAGPDEHIIDAGRLRRAYVKNVMKALSVVAGICVALAADLNLFELVDRMLDVGTGERGRLTHLGGTLLTGLAIGLGSGPLHKIITSIEKAKQQRVERA